MASEQISLRRRTQTLNADILHKASYPPGSIIEVKKSTKVDGGSDVLIYIPEKPAPGVRKKRHIIHPG